MLFVQAVCIYHSGNNFIGHYYQEKDSLLSYGCQKIHFVVQVVFSYFNWNVDGRVCVFIYLFLFMEMIIVVGAPSNCGPSQVTSCFVVIFYSFHYHLSTRKSR